MPRKSTRLAADTPPPAAAAIHNASTESPPAKGKLGVLIALLSRPEGVRLEEACAATGWQAHSVRGALAGAIAKRLGAKVVSEKVGAVRTYKAPAQPAAGAEA